MFFSVSETRYGRGEEKSDLSPPHSPLNATISSVSVLQITAERTESLVEGVLSPYCAIAQKIRVFYNFHFYNQIESNIFII